MKLCTATLTIIAVILLANCKQDGDTMVSENRSVAHYGVSELLYVSTNKADLKEEIVTVEGYIYDINHLNSRNTILLSDKKGEQASVICDMQKKQLDSLKNLKKGQFITVKGILKGSLNDVILLNCILSNTLTNE